MKKLVLLFLAVLLINGCDQKTEPYITLSIDNDSYLVGEVVKANITTNIDNIYAYGESNIFNGLWDNMNWVLYRKNTSGEWIEVYYSVRRMGACVDGKMADMAYEPPSLTGFNFSEFEWDQTEYYPIEKRCGNISYTDRVRKSAGVGTYKIAFCYTHNISRKIYGGALEECMEHVFDVKDSTNKQTLFGMPENSRIKIVDVGSYYPGYSLIEIYNDGLVVYQSGMYVPDVTIEEKRVFQIPEEKFKKILTSFYENDFFSLNGTHYDSPDVYDASTSITSININGSIYSVSEYAGSGPDKLQKINNAIWDLYCERFGDCWN